MNALISPVSCEIRAQDSGFNQDSLTLGVGALFPYFHTLKQVEDVCNKWPELINNSMKITVGKSWEFWTALELAILSVSSDENTYMKKIKKILDAGAHVNFSRRTNINVSPLGLAIKKDNLALTVFLMSHGARKQHVLDIVGKPIVAEKFNEIENKTYQKAKKSFLSKKNRKMVFLGVNDSKSLICCLPKDVLYLILTHPAVTKPVTEYYRNIIEKRCYVRENEVKLYQGLMTKAWVDLQVQ